MKPRLASYRLQNADETPRSSVEESKLTYSPNLDLSSDGGTETCFWT